jgi:hypothetical protein
MIINNFGTQPFVYNPKSEVMVSYDNAVSFGLPLNVSLCLRFFDSHSQ